MYNEFKNYISYSFSGLIHCAKGTVNTDTKPDTVLLRPLVSIGFHRIRYEAKLHKLTRTHLQGLCF